MDDTTADQKRQRFGKLVTELQGEMSTAELAKAVGLSRNQLYLIKDGQSGTSPETVAKFVHAFNLRESAAVDELYRVAGFATPDELDISGPNLELLELGKRLRARREAMKYTLAEMGRVLGMTGEGYGYYERGERPITIINLRKVAQFLKTSVAALIGEKDETAVDEEELLAFYRGTPPDLRPYQRAALKALFEQADREETTHGKKAE